MERIVMFESTVFWIFATVALIAGLGVVLSPSVLYSALCLIIVFFSMAAFFILNNADFLATAQILVYGVGLTIVLLFGLMFTADAPFPALPGKLKRIIIASLGSTSVAGLLFMASMKFNIAKVEASAQWIKTLQTVGSTEAIGQLIFSKYVLPFEVASLLLLGAMIGAIMLSRKTFAHQPGLTFSIRDGRLTPTLEAAWKKDVGLDEAVSPARDITTSSKKEEVAPL
jgi:NADH:ubiquinone oxidoreductase subunit 6 (subunit J)